MAHVTALAAAREHLLRDRGWELAERGLYGAPPIRVVVGAKRHVTFDRALRLLGMGAPEVVRADDQGRMVVDELTLDDRPTIVCVQVGEVNTGVRQRRDDHGPRTRGGRMAARRRRIRAVGGGGSLASPPRPRRRRGRLLGDGRAQVVERAPTTAESRSARIRPLTGPRWACTPSTSCTTTDRMLQAVQRSGEAWLSGTTWDDRPAIRVSVSHWQTTEADIERLVAAFRAAVVDAATV